MSAYTTLRITRGKATELMIRKIAGGCTDNDLEAFLEVELYPRLYNARIVPDDSENDDDCV